MADRPRAPHRRWAAREGITVASWHTDQGVSGAKDIAERPALLEALAALRGSAAARGVARQIRAPSRDHRAARGAHRRGRMARPRLIPWHALASVRAGLPTTREAWLDRVLPLLRTHPHDADIAAALGVPRTTWRTWRAWITGAHAAGTLPEWGADPLPTTRRGAVVGAPLRGAARARAQARRAREAVIPAASCG